MVTLVVKSTMHVDNYRSTVETRIIHKKATHYNHGTLCYIDSSKSVPCVVVLTVEETVLLIPIPSYTATTLIVQLLPGGREEIV